MGIHTSSLVLLLHLVVNVLSHASARQSPGFSRREFHFLNASSIDATLASISSSTMHSGIHYTPQAANRHCYRPYNIEHNPSLLPATPDGPRSTNIENQSVSEVLSNESPRPTLTRTATRKTPLTLAPFCIIHNTNLLPVTPDSPITTGNEKTESQTVFKPSSIKPPQSASTTTRPNSVGLNPSLFPTLPGAPILSGDDQEPDPVVLNPGYPVENNPSLVPANPGSPNTKGDGQQHSDIPKPSPGNIDHFPVVQAPGIEPAKPASTTTAIRFPVISTVTSAPNGIVSKPSLFPTTINTPNTKGDGQQHSNIQKPTPGNTDRHPVPLAPRIVLSITERPENAAHHVEPNPSLVPVVPESPNTKGDSQQRNSDIQRPSSGNIDHQTSGGGTERENNAQTEKISLPSSVEHHPSYNNTFRPDNPKQESKIPPGNVEHHTADEIVVASTTSEPGSNPTLNAANPYHTQAPSSQKPNPTSLSSIVPSDTVTFPAPGKPVSAISVTVIGTDVVLAFPGSIGNHKEGGFIVPGGSTIKDGDIATIPPKNKDEKPVVYSFNGAGNLIVSTIGASTATIIAPPVAAKDGSTVTSLANPDTIVYSGETLVKDGPVATLLTENAVVSYGSLGIIVQYPSGIVSTVSLSSAPSGVFTTSETRSREVLSPLVDTVKNDSIRIASTSSIPGEILAVKPTTSNPISSTRGGEESRTTSTGIATSGSGTNRCSMLLSLGLGMLGLVVFW